MSAAIVSVVYGEASGKYVERRDGCNVLRITFITSDHVQGDKLNAIIFSLSFSEDVISVCIKSVVVIRVYRQNQ